MEAISSSSAPSSARPGTALLGSAVAAATAAAMVLYMRVEIPSAAGGHGENALFAWVLIAGAGLGALLCGYLALVWALSSLILLSGPASRIGTILLSALRVLAPRAARRMTLGAAIATTATGLALAPATAADDAPDLQQSGQIAIAATLTSTAPLPAGGSDPATPDDSSDSHEDASSRPALGWSEAPTPDSEPDPSPDHDDPAPEAQPPTDAEVEPETEPGTDSTPEADTAPQSSPQFPSTVDVQPGDSLWTITDDLLGPGADRPDDISALWPSLHAANSDVIGPDPDHLEPGQVLVVPADLSPQEHS